MRYFLWHVSTFVPICAKVLIAPWGLKVSWLLYLFFTYILLEHKPFNGYPVRVFANLQRQAECCMIVSLFLSSWVSPSVSALPFLSIVWAKGIQLDSLNVSLTFFLLYSYDAIQIVLVTLSIMTLLLDTEGVASDPVSWHRACARRILFRGVQVLTLMMAYESLYVRVMICLSYACLKGVIYLYTVSDRPDTVKCIDGDPVCFLQGRAHRL